MEQSSKHRIKTNNEERPVTKEAQCQPNETFLHLETTKKEDKNSRPAKQKTTFTQT